MPIRGSGRMTLDVKKKGEKPCTRAHYTTIVNCVCQPDTTMAQPLCSPTPPRRFQGVSYFGMLGSATDLRYRITP